MKKPKCKKLQVLHYLQSGKSLTKIQALEKFGMLNLGDCIFLLREYCDIKTIMCKNQKTKSRYAKYWMPEEVK